MAHFIVIGANGGIGAALIEHIAQHNKDAQISAVSRTQPECAGLDKVHWYACDYSPAAIADVVEQISTSMAAGETTLRGVYVCTGILHTETLQPEKRIEQLELANFETVMRVNAALPLLWLQQLMPLLKKSEHACFTAISARVGSIGDNQLGGWYSYRASKAALNMLLKTAAVECARRAKGLKLLAFHPGTTDTPLSEPFQANVPDGKLFEPAFVADRLYSLSLSLEADGKLSFIDWDHKPIEW